MKFYLSSYKLGNNPERLVAMMSPSNKIGYVPNALDYPNIDKTRRSESIERDMVELSALDLDVELLDLRDYFSKEEELRKKIDKLGAIFFRGGNTFILRQAMRVSGFDVIFKELLERRDFIYAGYSAGICVLAHDLKALQIVDSPLDKPYKEISDTIWEGLGFLDYVILPHYKSNHPESAAVNKVVEYCQTNMIPFRTLRDGEVIIIE